MKRVILGSTFCLDGEDKTCTQIFRGQTSWKADAWKRNTLEDHINMDLRTICRDETWIELAQNRAQ
jgi:hypothetical protein